MKKVLFVLQNAYRSAKYRFNNHDEWYADLNKSHTGRRLLEMIPDNSVIFVINASPAIGDCSESCYPPDLDYIKDKLKQIEPDLICGCGNIAKEGLQMSGVEFIQLPHPAWRQLSSEGFAMGSVGRRNILARLGLRSGDVIKGIDNTELVGPEQA